MSQCRLLMWDRITIDILDTHKVIEQQNWYVLVALDYFTKWTDTYALRKHTTRVVAHVIVNSWIVYHRVPRLILSDQGPEFKGQLFKRLTKILTSP